MKGDKRRYKGKQGKITLEYSRIFKGYTLADISGISDNTEFSDVKAISY